MFAARSCLCGGLALCSGAVTVTLGRVELGVVCEAAVPLRAHNNEVDRIATAEGATRLDDILTTCSPKSGNKHCPGADTVSRIQPTVRSGRRRRGRHFWPAQLGFGWQREHVLVRVCRHRKHHWKCPMYLANFRVCRF